MSQGYAFDGQYSIGPAPAGPGWSGIGINILSSCGLAYSGSAWFSMGFIYDGSTLIFEGTVDRCNGARQYLSGGFVELHRQ